MVVFVVMAYFHCWSRIRTRIRTRIPSLMVTPYHAEVFPLHRGDSESDPFQCWIQGGAPGACPLLWTNIFLISCSFWENVYVGAFPWIGAPTYVEPWICIYLSLMVTVPILGMDLHPKDRSLSQLHTFQSQSPNPDEWNISA